MVAVVKLPCVLLVLACCACASTVPAPDEQLPRFPAEPTADAFPGVSYPESDGGLSAPQAPVWLVGIDGATWELARPLLERGELPALASIVESGAHGTLHSEQPMISPALWATVATGVPRFRHGVVDFLVRRPGSYRTTSAGPPDRAMPALWELVGAAGASSAVVSWFGSYPAEQIRGSYVSKGFDPDDPNPRAVWPAALLERLRGLDGSVGAPERDEIARSDFLSRTLREDATTHHVLERLVTAERYDFVAVYFSGIDVVQHVAWRHMQPDSQAFPEDGRPDPRLAGVIPAYYRFVDRMLARIVELAPPEATLVIVSDHGGGPMRLAEAYHLQLDVLLERMGLIRGEEGVALAIDEAYRHEKRVWLNLVGTEPSGVVPVDQAADAARSIAERLEHLRTDTGAPVFAEVVDHVSGGSWQPGAAALTVRFTPQALLARDVIDEGRHIDFSPVRLRHPDVSGSHRPEGMLVLRGPGIRPGPLDAEATLYNIAPTVLYLLGLPQDARMLRWAPRGGGVLEAALDPALLQRRPIAMVPEYPGTDRAGLLRRVVETGEIDPAEQERMERLRALGYIR